MAPPEGLFSLRELAAELARLDGKDAEQLHQRLRNLFQRDLFRASQKSAGRTGAAYFGSDVLWRLRLLLPFVDMFGADSDHLKRLDDLIRVEERRDGFGADNTGLRNAIAGIRRGQDWVLAVTFLQNTETGGNEIWASLSRAEFVEDPTSPKFRQARMFAPPFALRAFFKVPATELLSPLLVAGE